MDKKLKLGATSGKIIYLLVPLTLAIWTILYLYFLSSLPLPANLYDYDEQLHIKEYALQRTLAKTARLNADTTKLSKVYELLSDNEICLDETAAAEKHMEAALDKTIRFADKEQIAITYLKKANLYRDLNKPTPAKINYDRSLNYLYQISLDPDFNESALNTACIDFNNLGVLHFLIAQRTGNVEQRQKYYFRARDYFVQARHLMCILDSAKSNHENQDPCFLRNIDENLNQCLVEMQFCASRG